MKQSIMINTNIVPSGIFFIFSSLNRIQIDPRKETSDIMSRAPMIVMATYEKVQQIAFVKR